MMRPLPSFFPRRMMDTMKKDDTPGLFAAFADRPLADRLRPAALEEIVGQDHLLGEGGPIRLMADSGKLTSFVLWGPPGCGKTTLARILATRTSMHFVALSAVFSGMADLRKAFDEAAKRREYGEGTLLFVDEIHRLNRQVEEVLYPAMEDYVIDIMIGKGPSARSVRIDLPKFTLIGATTRAGALASPLRDRFGMLCRLEYYTPQQLAVIVDRSAQLLEIEIDNIGSHEIACRSRGTPRIANRLLKRVRDYAQVKGDGVIDKATADDALKRLHIDQCGLDRIDRMILETIVQKFGGGPVGLDTLAAAVSEETETLEDMYEPYLMQQGFLQRTSRGRIATQAAYEILGIPWNQIAKNDATLFEEE